MPFHPLTGLRARDALPGRAPLTMRSASSLLFEQSREPCEARQDGNIESLADLGALNERSPEPVNDFETPSMAIY